MTRAEQIYSYPLYSPKNFLKFIRYSKATAKAVAAKIGGGKNWQLILADMIWCNIRYGAMDSRDYVWFDFINKSSIQRDRYLTSRRYFKTIKHFDKETFYRMIDKDKVYEDYSEYIKRKWLLVSSKTSADEIRNFINTNKVVLVKPVSSEQGRGIYKIKYDDRSSVDEFIELSKKEQFLMEELLINCDELQNVSDSLNTVRVYSLVDNKGKVTITNMFLRVGRKNSIVDNWGQGGIGYNINLQSGVIDRAGIDNDGNKFVFHPQTNIKMIGYEIPRFEELKDFAMRVAAHNKKVIYAGIDIAILNDRMELVEVNFPGGRKGLQVMDDTGRYSLVRTIW